MNVVGVAICAAASGALVWYHLTPLAVIDRYELPGSMVVIAKWLFNIGPAAALIDLALTGNTRVWTPVYVIALMAIMVVTSRAGVEQAPAHARARGQARDPST